MASIVERLTENIVERNLLREGAALSKKWEKTGLLEGIGSDMTKTTMARLLENQAKELLREASTMSAGDVEGFAAVAFPIVRRVFGGLIANELVAVQPMSLPSGLIFFLDFNYNGTSNLGVGGADKSVYGGDRLASQITGGVLLSGYDSLGTSNLEKSFYSLNNGFSSATGSISSVTDAAATLLGTATAISALSDAEKKAIQYDPDLLSQTSTDLVGAVAVTLSAAQMAQVDLNNLVAINFLSGSGAAVDTNTRVVRRLTHLGTWDATCTTLSDTATKITFYLTAPTGDLSISNVVANDNNAIHFARKDALIAGTGLGSIAGDLLALEGAGGGTTPLQYTPNGGTDPASLTQNLSIPEIDIKVDNIAVTALSLIHI